MRTDQVQGGRSRPIEYVIAAELIKLTFEILGQINVCLSLHHQGASTRIFGSAERSLDLLVSELRKNMPG